MDRNNNAEILKEPDEIIRAVARILDALQFTARMEETDNCNTCGKKYTCEYAPEPGDRVTWNCPLWTDQEETVEEKLTNIEGMNQEELERQRTTYTLFSRNRKASITDMLGVDIQTGIRYTPEGKGEAYLNIKDTGGVLLYEITKPYE